MFYKKIHRQRMDRQNDKHYTILYLKMEHYQYATPHKIQNSDFFFSGGSGA
jgi:hypothetical protein